jgi:hypothetical protein
LLADAPDDFFLRSDTDLKKTKASHSVLVTDDIAWQPHARSGPSCARKPHHKRSIAASPILPFAPADVGSSYFDWKTIGHCNRVPNSGMFPTSRTLVLEGGENCLVGWWRKTAQVGRWFWDFGWDDWKKWNQ